MRKLIFILTVLILSCNNAMLDLNYEYDCGCVPISISITQDSPFSWRNDIPALRASESTQKQMPSLDMERIFREDMEDEIRGVPPRFGYAHSVNYNLENSGEWITLPNGDRLWRLTISSPGALAISLLYDKFWIPDGAKFWVYSTDHRHSIGAITSADNVGTRDNIRGFSTSLVYGDKITIEYFLPSYASEVGFISIVYVVHGYRYIHPSIASTRTIFGGSDQHQRCLINVNCPDGASWRNEQNAVALIRMGIRLCTGFLVNTTVRDGHPWFITANHCLVLNRDDAVTGNTDLSYWRFYWHWGSPGCANARPAVTQWTTGARLIANNPISDFALLDLRGAGDPRRRPGITPFFLGWDRSGNSGTSGVGIHHPNGDIKKINFAYRIQNLSNPVDWGDGRTNLPHTLWNATWERNRGLTMGGSSGSPLINNSHRVIGQLAGSPRGQTCDIPNPTAAYGRFDVSWRGNTGNTPHSDRRRRLDYWLAPGVFNPPLTLDGIADSPFSVPSHSCGSATIHISNMPPGATINWTVTREWFGPGHPVRSGVTTGNNINLILPYQGRHTIGGTMNIHGTTVSLAYRSWWNYIHVPARPYIVQYYAVAGQHAVVIPCGQDFTVPMFTVRWGPPVSNLAGSTIHWSGLGQQVQGYGGLEFRPRVYRRDLDNFPTYNGIFATITHPRCGVWRADLPVRVIDGCYLNTGFSYYLNPASDVLTVNIDREAVSRVQSLMSAGSFQNDRSVPEPAFDILLYDNRGNRVRQASSQGGDTELDVADLPEGIYFLHIFDGVNNTPDIRLIVIER